MPLLVCPSCGASLRAAAAPARAFATCPRCLAEVPVPPPVPVPFPEVSGGPPGAASPPRAGEPPCRGCGAPLPAVARFCPACGLRAGAIPDPATGRPFLEDVRKDMKRTGRLMPVLVVLGVLGLFSSTLGAAQQVPREFRLILILTVSTLVFGGLWLSRQEENTAGRGFGRVVRGLLAGFGALCLLSFVLGGALLVFLFVVCATGTRF